jgi:voltage-dependent anion channel protein 2
LQYKNDYAAVSTTVGIASAPITEFSAVIGSGDIALGSEISFDTALTNFTKYNVGFAVVKPDFSTSFFL